MTATENDGGVAADTRITDVLAHPISYVLPEPSVTSWGEYHRVSIVLVEVRTDAGITGFGECLGRFAPRAYAEAIHELYRPMLVGRSPFDAGAHSATMRRGLSGRAGGMAAEAMAGVDIALWDIIGKAAGLPLYRLWGGIGRTRLPAYASSVDWVDDGQAREDIAALLDRGFRAIKLKIGLPVERAVRRAALARAAVGDDVALFADANWAYSVTQAVTVGDALADHGFGWFEEPLVPEDVAGYRLLRDKLRVPLAAGESDFTPAQSLPLLSERLVEVIQPNISRAGGVTGTRAVAALAAAFNVAYAPHVGFSGIICEAASLHVAAAAENLHSVEVVTRPNPYRQTLSDLLAASDSLEDGAVPVPNRPGLGLDIDRDALERMRLP